MAKSITWVGTPNYSPGRAGHTIDHITLHIMAGYLAGTDTTFQNPALKTSATYGIGRNGDVHQYVRESDTAWADADGLSNQTGISIEHEGGLQQAQCTRACMDRSAELCADIARRYKLGRLVHNGLKGNVYLHREIPGTTHTTCPDLAPNGLDVNYVINKANQLLGYTTTKEDDVVTQADIDKIATAAAKKVWDQKLSGTAAGTRVAGIDSAANGSLKVAREIRTTLTGVNAEGKPDKANEWSWLTSRTYRIADLLLNKQPIEALDARIEKLEQQQAHITELLEQLVAKESQ